MNPLKPRAILPRNMTAKAAYPVPGNPAIARPESGVGNCHPGLEFDVRELDRHFLPGLVFDFCYGAGARLVRIGSPFDTNSHIKNWDLKKDLYFLWAVQARFGDDPDRAEPEPVPLLDVDGYTVLRKIMDLECGHVDVLTGILPRTRDERANANNAIAAFFEQKLKPDSFPLPCEIFSGERAKFITDNDVIDTELIARGELTSSLCSPWQWDFADCYCFYWASSKPDIVIGTDGDAQVLNFQRDRSSAEQVVPATTFKKWTNQNSTAQELISGWTDLPIVVSGHENVTPRVPVWTQIANPLTTPEAIAAELHILAGLEHALCIEYLYSKFSLNVSRHKPWRLHRRKLRQYKAAGELFSIAVDEMRHLRWVNEALWLLGKPPALNRAQTIGSDLRRFFQLRPLTPKVLDEFIAIEAPASVLNNDPQQLDSVYARTLCSLNQLNAAPGKADLILRLQQIIKVIIDEGKSHWVRFRGIKSTLAGMKPEEYLRFTTAPLTAVTEPFATVQLLCDAYYDLLLHALYITFRLGRRSRREWLDIAHRVMFALDEAGFLLSTNNYAPRFTLPDWCHPTPVPGPVPSIPTRLSRAINKSADFGRHGPESLADLIMHESAIDELFTDVDARLKDLSSSQARLREMASRHTETMNTMKCFFLLSYRKKSEPQ